MDALDILNKALSHLGIEGVSTLTGNKAEVSVFLRQYPHIKETLLSLKNWGFAVKRQDIVLVEGSQNKYRLPADFLRIIGCYDRLSIDELRATSLNYEREGAFILTDRPPSLKYVYKVVEDDMPGFFIVALSLRVAEALALPLTESAEKSKIMEAKAKRGLEDAFDADAREQGLQAVEIETPVITSRWR